MDILTVDWFRRIIIVAIFFFLSPWRWPHEWPKHVRGYYRDADKSLARPGKKQATTTEDFDVHISYL